MQRQTIEIHHITGDNLNNATDRSAGVTPAVLQNGSRLSEQRERRSPVSERKSENKKSRTAGQSNGRKRMPEPSRELCMCGHRATVHAAYRYACQAPGERKGFCECMRFIARSSPVGKRLRTLEREKMTPAVQPD
jgi:hypothetical protein